MFIPTEFFDIKANRNIFPNPLDEEDVNNEFILAII